MKAFLLAAALALCALPCAAQVYKWTDADGRVHFSDKAPPDTAKKQETLKIQASPPAAAPQAQLVMYATSWCGYCRKARAHLASKGISYREVDIEASAANRSEYKALGGRGVPFFVKDGRTMRGFNAERLDQFLAQAR
jgi:glutaredoxin